MTLPVAPEDVRVRLAPSGAEILCDLLYDGEDADGIHRWVAVPRVPVRLTPGTSLLVGLLPAHSGISLAGAEPP